MTREECSHVDGVALSPEIAYSIEV